MLLQLLLPPIALSVMNMDLAFLNRLFGKVMTSPREDRGADLQSQYQQCHS